jgi:O-antigen/teichoic acid export membrane protein
MELRILLKNTSYLIFTKVIKFIAGMIRAKFIAVYIGTLGSGIVSQLTQVTQAMSQFTLLGMNDGLVKQIAESDKERSDYRTKLLSLIKSYLVLISFTLVLTIILALIYSNKLTIYILGDIKYYNYFLIGLVSFPILVLNSISYALLTSYKLIKYIARSELILVVLNLFLFIPLLYYFGITGAVIFVTASLLTTLVINHYFAKIKILKIYNISLIDILRARIDWESIKLLFLFAGFGVTAGIAFIAAETITRSIIVTSIGIKKIGIYSPISSWSGLFTGFIIPSIGTYLYPRLCESKINSEIIGILNDSLRFVTLLMIPFLLLSIPIRFQIIPLFYSHEFLEAGYYMPWHFLGLLFYLWMYVFIQAMTATGRIKMEGVILIIICITDIVVVYFLVPIVGLYGFMFKFIVSPIIFFVFYFLYFKHQIHFKLKKENLYLMAYLVISFFIIMTLETYFIHYYIVNFVIGGCLNGFSFFLLKKSEKDFILKRLKIR